MVRGALAIVMSPRIPQLLQSTLPRDAVRLDLAGIRAGLIIALTFALLTARLPPAGAAVIFGPLRSMFAVSLMFLLIVASRLGGDSVGDVSSGLLGLVRLSGTTPRQWVAFRLSQLWIGFASVWIVRAPFIAFVWTLGGMRLSTILTVEAALLLAYFLLSNMALLISFGAQSRRQIAGRIVLLLFVFNTLVVLPASIAGSLNAYWPNWVSAQVVEVTELVSDFSVNSQFARVSSGRSTSLDLLPGALVFGGLGLAVLLRFWRLVASVGTMTVEERTGPSSRAAARVSRRCWDDALAWQSFVYVGRGGRMVWAKTVGYIVLTFVAWQAVTYGYQAAAMLMLPVLCGGLLMSAINKTSDCLTREINDRTIGTLLLTPHDYNDLAAGWRRGAWRLAAPDIVCWSLLTIVSTLVSPVAPPVMFCIGMLLVFSEHFFILSPLIPFTFKGITSGLIMILLFCIPVSLCILAGIQINPWLTPLFMAPLLLGITYLLKRVLPYWMGKKLTTIL